MPEEVSSLSPSMSMLGGEDVYVVLRRGLENLVLRDRKAADDLERMTNSALSVVDTALDRTKQINKVRRALDEIDNEKIAVLDADSSLVSDAEKGAIIEALDWAMDRIKEALDSDE